MSLDWLYTLDELKSISVDTKEGQARLQAQIKTLPELLTLAGIKLPARPKILCLMAGSCIEGLAFAHHFKTEVTCLDVQRQLLSKGVKEARKRGLQIRTIPADVRKLDEQVGKGFHLVTVMGSPLAHLNIWEVDRLLGKIKGLLSKQGFFLLDQADNIFRVLPQYSDAFVANREPPVITTHVGFNPLEGYFERLYSGGGKHAFYKMHLWSPWILEYMLKKNGFTKIAINAYADYSRIRTTLFTARL